jgi:hypothetical protein
LIEDRTLSIRSDFVDDAFISSSGEDIPCLVDGEPPDVLVGWVEENG